MPQFFIERDNEDSKLITISDKQDIKHLKTVLRHREEDHVVVTDQNEVTYNVIIRDVGSDSITAEIVEKLPFKRKVELNLTLAQSVLKSQGQDLLIQKATEVGVSEIIPLVTKRTVVKFKNDKDKDNKVERWQKIAYEACKQCERANIPRIRSVSTLTKLFEQKFDVVIACVERDAEYSLKDRLAEIKANAAKDQKILIIVGPEGGWSDVELALIKSENIKGVSLGKLILRAETAVIKALSNVIYELEE